MYGRAGNLFKMAKKWSSAGKTFVTVAQHHVKAGSKLDAATNYVDAANCYKKCDHNGERKGALPTNENNKGMEMVFSQRKLSLSKEQACK